MRWFAEYAWVDDAVLPGVLLEADGDRFARIVPGEAPPPDARRLPGLTIPGLANAHSHAFHRALRGGVQSGRGTFWTWRERMYAVADRLDPASYRALATAVYAEMALAGVTCVGEFHYLHHRPGGGAYPEPNAMGDALLAAASAAGIRITLLDACYLTGAPGTPLAGTQRRFGDGTPGAWRDRVRALLSRAGPDVRIGAAIHSVRAVPRAALPVVADFAREHGVPLHVHVSEQPAENAACLDAYGVTPVRLLGDAGALGPLTTAVHATHLDAADVALLGGTDTTVCLCPTTERDLADGLGPSGDLVRAGAPLCVGSDQHAVVDLLEEARAVELHERLRTGERGHFRASALLAAATWHGHAALGWPSAGRLEPGAHADLVTLRLDSPRTAGCAPSPETAVFAATAADVTTVVASGREIVRDGRHLTIDVPSALREVL
ncbi:formimidoylglutamate deiminase [Actinomadura rayongensis]|uniref:Formimidoylglutamate deiminase n=1 Tax=Actinomadura rayongensis TaxID=1429076 RepID=A0A6I4W4P1_9ACTN|nr:formimidoylglutamate deiminase [Actinomadura rayongensis]MXQ63385.1 formimidoylglutamate deiminase [Actinomadura rayongensis]